MNITSNYSDSLTQADIVTRCVISMCTADSQLVMEFDLYYRQYLTVICVSVTLIVPLTLEVVETSIAFWNVKIIVVAIYIVVFLCSARTPINGSDTVSSV